MCAQVCTSLFILKPKPMLVGQTVHACECPNCTKALYVKKLVHPRTYSKCSKPLVCVCVRACVCFQTQEHVSRMDVAHVRELFLIARKHCKSNNTIVSRSNCARMRFLEQSRESIVGRTKKCISLSRERKSVCAGAHVFVFFQAHVNRTDDARVPVSKLHESVLCQKVGARAHMF